jgi:hypothetical protein
MRTGPTSTQTGPAFAQTYSRVSVEEKKLKNFKNFKNFKINFFCICADGTNVRVDGSRVRVDGAHVETD